MEEKKRQKIKKDLLKSTNEALILLKLSVVKESKELFGEPMKDMLKIIDEILNQRW